MLLFHLAHLCGNRLIGLRQAGQGAILGNDRARIGFCYRASVGCMETPELAIEQQPQHDRCIADGLLNAWSNGRSLQSLLR